MEQTHKLELTESECQLIVNGLATLPYAQVAALIPKIMGQVAAQQTAIPTEEVANGKDTHADIN